MVNCSEKIDFLFFNIGRDIRTKSVFGAGERSGAGVLGEVSGERKGEWVP